jgi:hypothetical protein
MIEIDILDSFVHEIDGPGLGRVGGDDRQTQFWKPDGSAFRCREVIRIVSRIGVHQEQASMRRILRGLG